MRINLEAIKAREAAATPGTWISDQKEPYEFVIRVEDKPLNVIALLGDPVSGYGDMEEYANDAQFVAHARKDIPDLIKEVNRLKTELDKFVQLSLTLAADAEKLQFQRNEHRAEVEMLKSELKANAYMLAKLTDCTRENETLRTENERLKNPPCMCNKCMGVTVTNDEECYK